MNYHNFVFELVKKGAGGVLIVVQLCKGNYLEGWIANPIAMRIFHKRYFQLDTGIIWVGPEKITSCTKRVMDFKKLKDFS